MQKKMVLDKSLEELYSSISIQSIVGRRRYT